MTSTPTILVLAAVLVVDFIAAKKHKRRMDIDFSLPCRAEMTCRREPLAFVYRRGPSHGILMAYRTSMAKFGQRI